MLTMHIPETICQHSSFTELNSKIVKYLKIKIRKCTRTHSYQTTFYIKLSAR